MPDPTSASFRVPGAAAGNLRQYAGLAQLAERLFRTQQVISSILISSSSGLGHPHSVTLALHTGVGGQRPGEPSFSHVQMPLDVTYVLFVRLYCQ